MPQISLLAAYIAGMVALFAPCCISYLFPAYLGNVFRERKHVVFMTLIYSLGIFTVMLPIVLGAKILTTAFMEWHNYTYLFGSIMMLAVAIMTLIGFKLPMPHFVAPKISQNGLDIPATFSLGVISGITSACCAPVLLGVLTLSSFSPTLLLSLGVGISYVLGMVSPLYIASFFIKEKDLLQNPILKKKVFELQFGQTTKPIFVSNIVGSAIFFISGLIMLTLTLAGKVSMPTGDDAMTKTINQIALTISGYTKQIPFIDLLFVIAIAGLFYWASTKLQKKNQVSHSCCEPDHQPDKK